MTALLRPELRRVTKRRMTMGISLALLALSLFMLWGTHRQASQFGTSGRAAAVAEYQRVHADWVQNHVAQEKDCRASMPPDVSAQDPAVCAMPEPTVDGFLPFGGSLRSITNDVRPSLQALLIFGSFIMGASLVCAEFATGAISTWLTFVPRRTRVYGSKLAAASLAGLAAAVLATLVLAIGLLVIAAQSELTVSVAERAEFLATLGRASLLGLYGAALGAAVGFMVRHTAAAIGVALAYLIAGEMILHGAVQSVAPWLLSTNLSAFVDHGTTYFVDRCTTRSDGGIYCTSVSHHVSFGHGALFLSTLAIVILLTGLVTFTRRDVN